MPKLETSIQEPMALYPVVEELDEMKGVLQTELSEFRYLDPEGRITLGRLARIYGQNLGPTDGVDQNQDLILQVAEKDFHRAEPRTLERGLYIPFWDPRYTAEGTEQLVRVRGPGSAGNSVVFPAREFRLVARSARDLTIHQMAKTRNANASNRDPVDRENRVGRSAAHINGDYIQSMNRLENELIETRDRLLIPLFRETYSDWQSHFKAKNLDRKRRIFNEYLHEAVDTATLNLNIGTNAVKAAHRAVTSNLYRRGSASEINSQWNRYIAFIGKYVAERRTRVEAARNKCEELYTLFEPFLATKEPETAN